MNTSELDALFIKRDELLNRCNEIEYSIRDNTYTSPLLDLMNEHTNATLEAVQIQERINNWEEPKEHKPFWKKLIRK